MEGGVESYEQGRPGQRRKWTSFEEESLLNVIDGILAGGQRCDTGSFKRGTLVKGAVTEASAAAQHNPRAKGWRNKSDLTYERLANIFGKDRANGNAFEVPTEMMEDQSNNRVEMDFDDDASASISRSGNMQSQVRKRKRHDEDWIILALNKMIEENKEGRKMLLESMVKGNEDRSDIANELNNMGLSALDQI